MKLFGITLLAASCYAQEPRRFNGITRMAYSQVSTTYTAKEFSKRMQNYGCHCFPGYTKAAGGAGTPVNPVDALCKELSRCHKCVEIDFDGQIDVNTGKYNWELQGDGTIDCSGNVNNDARKALCECDAHYAMQMGTTWADGDFDTFYWLAQQNIDAGTTVFDQEVTCSGGGACSGGTCTGNADQCCGQTYPSKEPYDSGAKSCCEDTTVFNALLQDCCPGGTVAAVGAC